MTKNILITGGAGFVGSNLAIFLNENLKGCQIICFDNLIRNGSQINASRIKDHGIKFIKGDVRNKSQLLELNDIDLIIDCSAEPSVLAAHNDPIYTIDTNFNGTVNCLELARRDNAGILFLSTNRVYPIEKLEEIPHQELPTRFDWNPENEGKGYNYTGISHNFSLEGTRSLYGASKLCSEHIILEYLAMFGVKGIINRFGIIAGPWQMGKIDQGLVGFWIAQHKYQKELKYIGYGGKGKQVRDALHVDDLCKIVQYQITHLEDLSGEIFNIGGGRNNSFSLLELTQFTQETTKTSIPIGSIEETRPSDIRIYITDNSYIAQKTGWSPTKSLQNIVEDIGSWIDDNHDILKTILT